MDGALTGQYYALFPLWYLLFALVYFHFAQKPPAPREA